MPETLRNTADTFIPGSRVLERKYYNSPEIFAKEKEAFIYQSPVCVGHVAEIPKAGNYFLFGVDDESLIISRGEDGGVNAFHNVCPHRTIRMLEEPKGSLNKIIQCDYHALTFDRETGRVINHMALGKTEGVDTSKICIQKSQVKVWNGFIFVNVDPARPMDFEKTFPHLPDLSRYNLEDLEFAAEISYDVPANWKAVFENYEECDHCAPKHPQLTRISGYTVWYNDITEGAALGGYMYPKAGFSDLTMTGNMCAPLLGDLSSEEAKRLYAYSFSPGMLLLGIHPDYVNYDLVIPVSTNETKVVSRWLFKKGAKDAPGYNPKDAIDFWDLTNQQDFLDITRRVQLGSQSRYYNPGWLSEKESLVGAFDNHYREVMKG